MAVVTRGRVIRPVDAEGVTRVAGAATQGTTSVDAMPRGRVLAREVVDAGAEARRILDRARGEAEALVARAKKDAEQTIRAAADEARAAATAELAAGFLALRAREERRAEHDLERTTEVALVLAERLVREAIELRPERVVAMARGALGEVRGARRAVLELHPLDAEAVRGHLEGAGLPREAIEIRQAPELARGDLRLHTDLGTLDARLSVQLERLAAALQDALRG